MAYTEIGLGDLPDAEVDALSEHAHSQWHSVLSMIRDGEMTIKSQGPDACAMLYMAIMFLAYINTIYILADDTDIDAVFEAFMASLSKFIRDDFNPFLVDMEAKHAKLFPGDDHDAAH